MTRVFAYCRVSTAEQTTDNQIQEIAAAGFEVKPQRAITETISGSVAALERKGFKKLLDKLEAGDVLVVTQKIVSKDKLYKTAIEIISRSRAITQTMMKKGFIKPSKI